MTLQESEPITCLNCGTRYHGHFCPNCGQKIQSSRVEWSEIKDQVASGLFSWEAPFYRTAKLVLSAPGKLSQAFIAGQRKSFYRPFPFYLTVVALHLLVGWLVGYDPIQAAIKMGDGQDHMNATQREVSYWMAQHINFILPVWIVVLSLMDRLFFWKSGFNWPERLVHYTYAVGGYILLTICLIPFVRISVYFQLGVYVILLLYMPFTIHSFHRQGWRSWLKGFFLALLSFVFYVALVNTVLYLLFSWIG